ncbi:hypothetical protein GQ54DRAFT_309864 [Martensiomyces pterosporus]|nr:hypothetical protein GQ54DRAFT_309864 [Martensiomyces pterosporus]
MLNEQQLASLRYWSYVAVCVLNFIEFILCAVTLSALPDDGSSSNRSAVGWTIFVTVVTILVLPAMLFARSVVGSGFLRFLHHLNRIAAELTVVSTSIVAWFISAVVMSAYGDDNNCWRSRHCSKYRATTAFAWLIFFNFLVSLFALTVMAKQQRRAGRALMRAFTVDYTGTKAADQPPQVIYAEAVIAREAA